MARVLLVDDDIAEISAVKRVLARGGHHPILATNAKDALVSVAEAPPDLLLVGSTCESGDALRRLAEDDGARALPLLVIGENPAAPAQAAQVGRPVDPGQLIDQVTALLAAAASAPTAGPTPTRAPRSSPRPPDRPSPSRRAVPSPSPSKISPPTNGAPAPAATDARRAAADALRARAEELRRKRPEAPAASEPAPPPVPAPARAPALDLEDGGLEAILRRAEEAERAHAAEKKARARQADRATVEAAQRAEAEQLAVEKAKRARAAEERAQSEERARAAAEEQVRAEAEARVRAEEEVRARAEAERLAVEKANRARAAAEEQARVEAEARARAEERARTRAEAERLAVEKANRARAAEQRARAEERASAAAEQQARAEAEARARAEEEARARAEAERLAAEEEGRRASEAEARARAEAEARRSLEEELEELRTQVQAERRAAEEKIQSVIDRAAAEERASEDLRRLAEEEARRQQEEEARRRQSEEDELRRAIEGARAEMETLRKRTEAEARRRAEAEAEVERLAREADRRAAEAAALPAPFDFPIYRPPQEDPPPDPGEESARRRVAALRERSAAPAAPREEPAPAPERAAIVRAPPPELKGGTLADLPAPRLLALAARAAACGRIDFEGEVTRSVWLEDGRVVGASSADPAERVEELALRLGLVTRDQHRQIAPAAGSLPSRRAALLLLERGFLKPTELTALVRRRTEEVVFGVFAEAGARFHWAAAEVPPDERTALERSTLALAVEGVRRRWLADRVDAVLGGAGTLLAPVPTGPSAADLALSPEERRAVALADGLRTVDEIVAASPLDPLSTRQALAALILIGSLAVRVFQGGRPASAATAAIDLARVREKLDQVRRADYFTILGVGRLCTPHEVRDAVDRLRAEFDPRRFQGVREEGLEERLREILAVVGDAREILVDDALRAEYLRGLGD